MVNSTEAYRRSDLIPSHSFYPDYDNIFTRSYGNGSGNWHLKQPKLSDYNPDNPNQVQSQVLHEVRICELLRKQPHPNIAQYHGCDVQDGRITGLLFTKYDRTLMERANPSCLSKRMFAERRSGGLSAQETEWLVQVEQGLRHLHSLGIIHNDINPSNIVFEKDKAVINDFGSCCFHGADVKSIGRTYQWHDEEATTALPSNDLDALEEIQLWLAGDLKNFKFDT
ncbi:hypothetical protein N7510_001474 [Penicillium lagena]|uniref:uncharacterized protein n=1 Tax=Penicillium lagena TaxID=94218 RepID=UPI0025422F84|nr:uncharacterized protein N7510_001474 [Penicillium lagena]KAJ5625165.1 hypothetical protein N7510_001474 [Penicillium lagena]